MTTSMTMMTQQTNTAAGISQSNDPNYPYNFTGRLWFLPSLVKVPKPKPKPKPNQHSSQNTDLGLGLGLESKNIQILSLFGYTLGGSVCLEYDTSPVGPYREYVTMSALVMKRGTIGQWGSRLYVSTSQAEKVCRDVWGVPAELATIDFVQEGEVLRVDLPPSSSSSDDMRMSHDDNDDDDSVALIRVGGWKNTRVLVGHGDENGKSNQVKRWGNIPVYWTPTIKALWLPLIPFRDNGGGGDSVNSLPLHRLRLSASAIRLHWSGINRGVGVKKDRTGKDTKNENQLNVPLGLGLVVDNVLIEIGKRCEEDL